jgi:hypothetical protein
MHIRDSPAPASVIGQTDRLSRGRLILYDAPPARKMVYGSGRRWFAVAVTGLSRCLTLTL